MELPILCTSILRCTGLSCKKSLENSQIRLNISRFLIKFIEDKKEKAYTKQLESSLFHQIFVLGISASTITFI
jgi:hypothetical protein